MRKVQQNEKPLVLQCNEDGVWEKYEPYMTIECPTEEDYDFIVRAVEFYKKSKQSEPISHGHENGGWISVDERLPEDCTHVIVCDEDGTVGEAFCYKKGRFEWMDSYELAFVTHWMPLPEPPDTKGGAE